MVAVADMSLTGHEVRLCEFPKFKENLERIRRAGEGINLVGVGRNGLAKLAMVATDIPKALNELKRIVVIILHQKD
jgi:hypothetical protein